MISSSQRTKLFDIIRDITMEMMNNRINAVKGEQAIQKINKAIDEEDGQQSYWIIGEYHKNSLTKLIENI